MIKKNIEKGDIWLINLNPSRKGELGKNSRPCIVLQASEANKIGSDLYIITSMGKKDYASLNFAFKNLVECFEKPDYVPALIDILHALYG